MPPPPASVAGPTRSLHARKIRVARNLRDARVAKEPRACGRIFLYYDRGRAGPAWQDTCAVAEAGTSVSRLLADELVRLVNESERYHLTRTAALGVLDDGLC